MTPNLLEKYNKEVIPALVKKFKYKNKLQAPKLKKIVINMGVGVAVQEPKFLEGAVEDLTAITGQKPVVTKARLSIAGFKLREGNKIGCKVTLRKTRMYEFMDRLINVAIPRIKDFRGINANSFDNSGNYTFGLKEQVIFPEVKLDSIQRVQGMDITFNIKSSSIEESREFLSLMGMPFRKK